MYADGVMNEHVLVGIFKLVSTLPRIKLDGSTTTGDTHQQGLNSHLLNRARLRRSSSFPRLVRYLKSSWYSVEWIPSPQTVRS
jgi:hypothetical protein